MDLEISPEQLQQGRYVLVVEALWNEFASDPNSDYRQFCVKLQSSVAVKKLAEVSTLADSDKFNLLKEIMLSRLIQIQSRCQVLPYSSRKGAYKILSSSAAETFYGCIAVVNHSAQDIYENFVFTLLDGFKIEGQPAGSKEAGLNVPAGAMDIILLKRHGERKANFHFKA